MSGAGPRGRGKAKPSQVLKVPVTVIIGLGFIGEFSFPASHLSESGSHGAP
jgi:hypothetical protein